MVCWRSSPPVHRQARARLVRSPASGRLEVYFGDRADPIMIATDTTLDRGRVGVGSFDDTAEFRRIQVRGEAAGTPQ